MRKAKRTRSALGEQQVVEDFEAGVEMALP
jgi:hypothetical protein